jgi:hypothetical protein
MSITMRLPIFWGVAIILGLFAAEADAGDWRELARKDGIAIAVDALGMRRHGDKLSVDLVLAMLPERQLPIYGVGTLDIDCATREASVSGIQYHLANGDTFGARTGEISAGRFAADDEVEGLCKGRLPPGPGADSALAYFKASFVQPD